MATNDEENAVMAEGVGKKDEEPSAAMPLTDSERLPSSAVTVNSEEKSTHKGVAGEDAGTAVGGDDAGTAVGGEDAGTATGKEKASSRGNIGLEPGMCLIKPEFIDHNHKRVLVTDFLPDDMVVSLKREAGELADPDKKEDGPPTKKQKVRGRNKTRPPEKRPPPSERLCPTIMQGVPCGYADRCKFSHDINGFMARKPKDLGDNCVNFEKLGRCHLSLTCRFGQSHLTPDFKNIINEELWAKMKNAKIVSNALNKELQTKLWKRKYNFKKAEKAFKLSLKGQYEELETVRQQWIEEKRPCVKNVSASAGDCNRADLSIPGNSAGLSIAGKIDKLLQNKCHTEISPVPKSSPSADQSGASVSVDACEKTECNPNGKPLVPESQSTTMGSSDMACDRVKGPNAGISADAEGIKFRPMEKKKIHFEDKLYLAPLTTVGNLPFRRICKRLGADITCGEMAVVTNLLQAQQSEWALLKRHESEDLFGVQLCGSFPDTMTKCAQMLTETCDIDFIDVNCGCPIDFIFKKGEGSAMMGRKGKLEQVVRGMRAVMGETPVTVKIRTGIYEDKYIAHDLVPRLRDWGASLVTLHGRSREMRYTKLADWEYINKCATLAKPMPLFGSGDILSYEEANLRRENTNVSGVMIARGALIKPWIFTEIKEQRHWDISSTERLDIMQDFVNCGLSHWGSDQQGVANTRKFLLEWLSFTHRYVPVGLLERLPQHINEKPPYYFGRNDLETLMASSNSADWVRISEMLLGPVPDGFTFIPKHKANAYK